MNKGAFTKAEHPDIVDPFKEDLTEDVEELQRLLKLYYNRILGLEEVVRMNDKSYLRMKKKYHEEAYNRHSENMTFIDKELKER